MNYICGELIIFLLIFFTFITPCISPSWSWIALSDAAIWGAVRTQGIRGSHDRVRYISIPPSTCTRWNILKNLRFQLKWKV